VSAGGWSPAQITEHVTAGIEIVTAELAGRAGMALRLSAPRRFLLRMTVLPRILRTGRFPARARAPRELRPSDHMVTQAEAMTRLQAAVAALERTAAVPDAGGRRLTMPYFGRIPAPRGIRFLAMHARHHMAQMKGGRE